MELSALNIDDYLIKPIVEEDLLEYSSEDIDVNIDYPKLVIQSEDLIKAISLSSSIVQQRSNNIVYNSLVFISNSSNVRIFATDELSQFTYNINPIQNNLELVFCITPVLLIKLSKLLGNKTMFFMKDNNLYIRLLNGDLLLDLITPNMNLLALPTENKQVTESFEIPLKSLGKITSSMLPILKSEIRPDFRKISFLGDKALNLSSYYYIESEIKTPNMSLRLQDTEFINKLYKLYSDRTIRLDYVKSSINRIVLTLENISFIFISGKAEIDDLVKTKLESLIKPIDVVINYDRFNKIINLAANLINSTNEIELKLNNNILYITLISLSGRSVFSIKCDTTINNKEYSVILKTDPLKKLLVSFSGTYNIGLSLTDCGVIFEKEGVKAILMKSTD